MPLLVPLFAEWFRMSALGTGVNTCMQYSACIGRGLLVAALNVYAL